MEQKRLEIRDLCSDLVKITWMPQPELSRTGWAVLGDISPSGACLEIEEAIPADAIVVLEFGTDRCLAIVQYCKYDKVNYLLGVKFEDGYQWSIDRWEPKHLIQLQSGKTEPPDHSLSRSDDHLPVPRNS